MKDIRSHAATEELVLRNGQLTLSFDPLTGTLLGIMRGASGPHVTGPEHGSTVALRTNGSFAYVKDTSMNSEIDSGLLETLALRMTAHDLVDEGEELTLLVEQTSTLWKLCVRYSLDRRAPVLGVSLSLEYTGKVPLTLDGLEWKLPAFRFADPSTPSWADIKASPVRVYSLQDKGLAALWRKAEGDSASIERRGDSLVLVLSMAGRVVTGTCMSTAGFHMAILADTGATAMKELKTFLSAKSISATGGAPSWVRPAHIYETFIGSWPMDGDGRSFSPYPTVADLINDLPRIRDMGFTILYLMPRHPFPSYSTASLADVGLQYGDGPGTSLQVAKLITAAHAHGLKLILDVILHGGLDASALAEQKKRQAFFGLADAPIDGEDGSIAHHDFFRQWIVYEKAHEPFWSREAPDVHPFWAEHPEWFSKRKNGSCQYTYTRSFDLRNPGFQDFFASELLRCVQELGVDGFRFDAPSWTWRQFNWGQDSYRASWTANGCIEILARAHHHIMEKNRDVCFYVESMDPNITKTAHLQYTYDTYWGVIDSLGRREITAALARTRLAYIASTRVDGIVDINTVDSHDTCWWFKIGGKWARERYSPERARLLFAVICFLDAGVQMFSGGEIGMEDWITGLLRLRAGLPVLQCGVCHPDLIECDDENVLPLWRIHGTEWILPVINFGGTQSAVHLSLPEPAAQEENLFFWPLTGGSAGRVTGRDGSSLTLSLEQGCVGFLCTEDFRSHHLAAT